MADMQAVREATRTTTEEIYAIRDDAHDQSALAAEYLALTEREAILLWAIQIR